MYFFQLNENTKFVTKYYKAVVFVLVSEYPVLLSQRCLAYFCSKVADWYKALLIRFRVNTKHEILN